MITKSMLSAAVVAALISVPVFAQQMIYPAKGQSAKQQQKDEAACYIWAKEQTGYDPAQATQYVAPPPPPPPPSVAQPATKPVGGGVAKGAMAGAAIGAIGGNDVGNAAAKGAAVGGLMRHARNRGAQQQAAAQQQQAAAQQQQAAAQQQQVAAQQQQASAQQKQNYQRAYGACFEGRGYTVK